MSGDRLSGLNALVIGGGSGIGAAVVRAYLDEGALVTVLERDPGACDALLGWGADGLTVVRGDATSPPAVADAVERAVGADGGLDQLTCCVGRFDHRLKITQVPLTETLETARAVWEANVLSTLTAASLASGPLVKARGSITLTVSESAFRPSGGGVLYGSSKWALRGVVDHLSVELAPYVRVNGVSPGGTVATAFASKGGPQDEEFLRERARLITAGTLLQVAPEPVDHTGAYVYLADPRASRVVTGVVVRSDGGHG